MNRRDFIQYPHPGWEKDKGRTQVCLQVDTPGCIAVFEETMMGDWLAVSETRKSIGKTVSYGVNDITTSHKCSF